jgi:hypothetical protein
MEVEDGVVYFIVRWANGLTNPEAAGSLTRV